MFSVLLLLRPHGGFDLPVSRLSDGFVGKVGSADHS